MNVAYDAYSYRPCSCVMTLYCAGQFAKGPHPPQQQDEILNPRECQRLPATCELLSHTCCGLPEHSSLHSEPYMPGQISHSLCLMCLCAAVMQVQACGASFAERAVPQSC